MQARWSARRRTRRRPACRRTRRVSFSAVDRSSPVSPPAQDAEHHQPGHDHDRVADGRDRGDDEPALGVQDGDRNGADRVEQHLRDEEAQQERRELLLLLGDRRVVARRWRAAGRSTARRRRRRPSRRRARAAPDAEHAAGEALGFGLVAAVEQLDERRAPARPTARPRRAARTARSTRSSTT